MKRKSRDAVITVASAVVLAAVPFFLARCPGPQPLTVWLCCSVLGCREVSSPAKCPASDDLTSCDCPLTNPDGSVGCGC